MTSPSDAASALARAAAAAATVGLLAAAGTPLPAGWFAPTVAAISLPSDCDSW